MGAAPTVTSASKTSNGPPSGGPSPAPAGHFVAPTYWGFLVGPAGALWLLAHRLQPRLSLVVDRHLGTPLYWRATPGGSPRQAGVECPRCRWHHRTRPSPSGAGMRRRFLKPCWSRRRCRPACAGAPNTTLAASWAPRAIAAANRFSNGELEFEGLALTSDSELRWIEVPVEGRAIAGKDRLCGFDAGQSCDIQIGAANIVQILEWR
jgi:hypothetical protein